MTHRFIVTLTLALAAVASGCSAGFEDQAGVRQRDTTVVERESSSGSFGIGEEENACINARTEESFPGGLEVTVEALGELTDEQYSLVIAALDACVSGAAVAPFVVEEFSSGLGVAGPGPVAVECVGEQLDGEVGAVMLPASVKNDPSGLFAVMDACVGTEFRAEALAVVLGPNSGLRPGQVECVAEVLAPEVLLSDLAAFAKASADAGPPPQFAEVFARANSECL